MTKISLFYERLDAHEYPFHVHVKTRSYFCGDGNPTNRMERRVQCKISQQSHREAPLPSPLHSLAFSLPLSLSFPLAFSFQLLHVGPITPFPFLPFRQKVPRALDRSRIARGFCRNDLGISPRAKLTIAEHRSAPSPR